MEQLSNGYTIDVPTGAFPLSTDSMLLSGFVRLPRAARVLDLGSGCATLGILLCARDPTCQVTGVELDQCAHQAALENISRNGLEHRLSSICADLRSIPDIPEAGSYHCCVSNPPYFSGGPSSQSHPAARREDHCTLKELFETAARALRFGGDFFLVHRPERLAEITACGAAVRLEAKRLRLVRHRADGPVSLILLSFRKGAKPGLCWEECSLYDTQGQPTQVYRDLYHL